MRVGGIEPARRCGGGARERERIRKTEHHLTGGGRKREGGWWQLGTSTENEKDRGERKHSSQPVPDVTYPLGHRITGHRMPARTWECLDVGREQKEGKRADRARGTSQPVGFDVEDEAGRGDTGDRKPRITTGDVFYSSSR
eukprot:2677893-Rhodomonas_salina.2